MPVETLAVTSVDTLWTLEAGASRTAAVAAPDDDATSYIRTSGDGAVTSFTVANSALTTETINSVTLNGRLRFTFGGPDLAVDIYVGASLTTSHFTGISTSWTSDGIVMATKPGGGNWGVSDVNAMTFDLYMSVPEGSICDVTTLTVDVDYNASGGGGLHTVPMMGAGLL